VRRTIWVLTLCCAGLVAGSASAQDYPFCIQGGDFGGGLGDCSFSTYQQCLAAASGRDASCGANPYFNAGAATQPQPPRSRASRRRP
jgi:hypothetical protein